MAMARAQPGQREIVLALWLAAALGCASPGAPPAATIPRCQLGPGDTGATTEARAHAVLDLLRGCDAANVARAHATTPQRLDEWRGRFVSQGIAGLLTARQADPGELGAALRGTWVLISRIARGELTARAEGLMIVGDIDSLILETGVLSDEFAEVPLGDQAGQWFRLGQYGRLRYDRRPGATAAYRVTSGELVGSFSDYPHGIRSTQVDLFVREGEAFVGRPAPSRTYSPDHSDQMVVMGDFMLITWTGLDVVDTWHRVLPGPPPLTIAPSLAAAWAALKASGTLLEKRDAHPTDLVGAHLPLTAGLGASPAPPARPPASSYRSAR
jgi:hypothetical protein